jgi:type II secretory pathway pseudopilin PulG
MVRKGHNEGGFTFMEIAAVLLIFLVLIVVVVMQVGGVFGGSRGAAMETDIHTVDTALGQYILGYGKPPTSDGNFPSEGDYALIDFNASFNAGGKTWTFYPDFVKKLPKHHDEGVWRIDSNGTVSVNMDPDDY